MNKRKSPVAFSLLLPGLLAVALSACGNVEEDEQDVVAKVFDERLTRNDLIAKLPPAYSLEDSTRLAEGVISAWIAEKALLRTAEDNLSDEQKNVQKQLTEYRNSLIVYNYERAFIRQKMDTNITEAELRNYFEANQDNFRLKRYIAKVRFVKLSVDAPKQKDIEEWLRSEDEEDIDALYEYSRKYAENFYVNNGLWLYVDDLSREVPLPVNDIENLLKNNKFITLEQDGYRYFVYIHDYRLKGDLSPLPLERKRVRDLILNRRKVELIDQMREDVVKQGFAEGNIKTYTP